MGWDPGDPGCPLRCVSPYQIDAVDLYVLEEDAGHMLCVPLHSWVIWEVPAHKKHNLNTFFYQVPFSTLQ